MKQEDLFPETLPAIQNTDDNKPHCTKGWSGRCANAKSKKCTCGCGGYNHGKCRPTNLFSKDPKLLGGKKSESHLFVDEIFGYAACGGPAKCGLRIYLKTMGNSKKAIVILTELPDNPGTSITNYFEKIATLVKNEKLDDVEPSNIIWIEHYPPELNSKFTTDGTFSLVSIHFDTKTKTYSNASWEFLNNINNILGDQG